VLTLRAHRTRFHHEETALAAARRGVLPMSGLSAGKSSVRA
jgi:hypothetical protein